MGRLFDAVAALIGVRQQVNYEAQAAIELEALVDPDCREHYPFQIDQDTIDPAPVFRAVVDDLHKRVPAPTMAARFHNAVAQMVLEGSLLLRQQYHISQVVLSGGVWQNMVLLKRALELLQKADFFVYTHTKVPANDGGLALGQAVIAHHSLND